MRTNPRPYLGGWRCVAAMAGAVAPPPAVTPRVAVRTSTGAGPACDYRAGTVHVRFTPSDIPVVTSCPANRTAAIQAAGRALASLGRSYLGGHLEITSSGPVSATAMLAGERLAAARAVENVLRGGCGSVRLPLPEQWPETPGCRVTGGCGCQPDSGPDGMSAVD